MQQLAVIYGTFCLSYIATSSRIDIRGTRYHTANIYVRLSGGRMNEMEKEREVGGHCTQNEG